MAFTLTDNHIDAANQRLRAALDEDYEHLGSRLERRGVSIEDVTARAMAFRVAVPSWGVGTGGTRFARFPGAGEPRTIFEKLEDCETIYRLVRVTPGISLHIPWDRPERPSELSAFAAARGLHIDSTNSNTFQDQDGQALSYKFGSLTNTDAAVRRQAIEHNLECLALARELGAAAHTVWIADGGNFPGQVHARKALDRYLDSLREIYAALPDGCRLFIEHKFYEPAFYSTVLNDWGTSYVCAKALGDRAFSLVDLGHHAPNVNIEQIVARLIQLGKLGGFHFNDSKYGDDDLDSGSIKPFQLFLIFNELVDAELEGVPGFGPAYMLDQSHNVTDPIESLVTSAIELVRALVQAHLVDRAALAGYQEKNDALMALQTLKQAFTTDVSPILAMARLRSGGAIDPIAVYRASEYRRHKAQERALAAGDERGSRRRAGIV
ncbi:MAG TPA: L-rhamnose catabolism isomerase [Vicinamibacterales bacterium]|nr:L-rhamnose catabolism isomerase [Vicinamibacterales bacterium]